MIKPTPLRQNDQVYILNTSRKGVFEADFIVAILRRWGLNPVIGHSALHSGDCQFAAPLEVRFRDLQEALDNPLIKAVFFCRGGYGLVQLLDRLSFDGFLQHPKWLIGYSDITYLHSHLHSLGVMSVHASMLMAYRSCAPQDMAALTDILFHRKQQFTFTGLEIDRPDTVSGVLIGGNLSILHTVIGTASDVDMNDKILIIEDVFENLMSVERMLYALKRSGKFDNLKALLIGDFVIPLKDNEMSNSIVSDIPEPDETSIGTAFRLLVRKFFKDAAFPIAFGLPVGHVPGRNTPLILGSSVCLRMSTDTLELTYKT